MYGKQTECAIAAMSRLAEVYDGGVTNLSADDIADSRGLPRPFVRKILSVLAQAGLVIGSRGPVGGCSLSREPGKIKIYDVFKLFERQVEVENCPFGGGRCGVDEPCPLHEKLAAVQDAIEHLLHDTTFEDFHGHNKQNSKPRHSRKKAKRGSRKK